VEKGFNYYNKTMTNISYNASNNSVSQPENSDSNNLNVHPFMKVIIPANLGDDSAGQIAAPENGAYHNALVRYEDNDAIYIYSSDGIPTKVGEEHSALFIEDYDNTIVGYSDDEKVYANIGDNGEWVELDIEMGNITILPLETPEPVEYEPVSLGTSIDGAAFRSAPSAAQISDSIQSAVSFRSFSDNTVSEDPEPKPVEYRKPCCCAPKRAVVCPFRKVSIPANLGTDEEGQPEAPENGKYQNALVKYESNNALYIYSSDGIPTKININSVGIFTNSYAGIILGSDSEGKIYANPDGTGSVNGWEELKTTVNNKVDKIAGKGLSTNDYTDADKAKLSGLTVNDATITLTQGGVTKGTFTTNQGLDATIELDAGGGGGRAEWGHITGTLSDQTDLNTALDGKVDKVEGKGLSTNDYTTAEKTKLAGIEAGAQVNLPNTVVDANYVHTDNNYTTAEKTKLDGLNVGNGTITITQGGVTKGSFTTNQSNNGTIEIDAGGSGTPSWGSITGTLSNQTDLQDALDAKMTGNAAITGATKTKITYDSKGLVTAGTDLIASDIPDLSNTYYRTTNPSGYISQAVDDNSTSSTTLGWSASKLVSSFNGKVDKVAGKGLSTNDYTDADKADVAEIDGIVEKIPTQASSSNQLADKNFVNSSINSVTAYYITKNAQGDQFSTKAELDATTTFYSGGEVRVPTRNDYCIILADETKTDPVTSENPTTRYIYQNSGWEFQYVVNKTTLTAAQLAAVNSNITAALTTKLQGIEDGAEVNVNADWNAVSGDAQILNKPTDLAHIDSTIIPTTPTPWITSSEIVDNAITTSKISDGAVTSSKLGWSILTAKPSSSVTTVGDTIIPFDTVASSIGTGLSISNNGILIGSGVSKVLVSYNIFFNPNSVPLVPYAMCRLYKNGVDFGVSSICGHSIGSSTYTSGYGACVMTQMLIDVTEGDLFQVKSEDQNGLLVSPYGSWFTVMAVG